MKVSCPICKKQTEWGGNDYRPFCSERCKLIDLGRWASGEYRVPVEPPEGAEHGEIPAPSPNGKETGDGTDSKGKSP